jgi:hypothetical protein
MGMTPRHRWRAPADLRSDRGRAPADLPSDVQITVTVRGARGHPLRERLAGKRVPAALRTVVALALGVAAVGAIIVAALGALHGDRASVPVGAPVAGARAAGPAGVAAAYGYGYPFRCLSITISASDPDFARAHVDHTSTCARYRGYVNASFHRVDGVWRLVLDEGQLFVPNALLDRCRASSAGCRPVPRRHG